MADTGAPLGAVPQTWSTPRLGHAGRSLSGRDGRRAGAAPAQLAHRVGGAEDHDEVAEGDHLVGERHRQHVAQHRQRVLARLEVARVVHLDRLARARRRPAASRALGRTGIPPFTATATRFTQQARRPPPPRR